VQELRAHIKASGFESLSPNHKVISGSLD
jgi:hypothetical protein